MSSDLKQDWIGPEPVSTGTKIDYFNKSETELDSSSPVLVQSWFSGLFRFIHVRLNLMHLVWSDSGPVSFGVGQDHRSDPLLHTSTNNIYYVESKEFHSGVKLYKHVSLPKKTKFDLKHAIKTIMYRKLISFINIRKHQSSLHYIFRN